MNQEQLKGMLGSRYQYRRILTSGEVLHLQKENPLWFTGQIAASLIAGCVRLDAVLFRDGNALRLGLRSVCQRPAGFSRMDLLRQSRGGGVPGGGRHVRRAG